MSDPVTPGTLFALTGEGRSGLSRQGFVPGDIIGTMSGSELGYTRIEEALTEASWRIVKVAITTPDETAMSIGQQIYGGLYGLTFQTLPQGLDGLREPTAVFVTRVSDTRSTHRVMDLLTDRALRSRRVGEPPFAVFVTDPSSDGHRPLVDRVIEALRLVPGVKVGDFKGMRGENGAAEVLAIGRRIRELERGESETPLTVSVLVHGDRESFVVGFDGPEGDSSMEFDAARFDCAGTGEQCARSIAETLLRCRDEVLELSLEDQQPVELLSIWDPTDEDGIGSSAPGGRPHDGDDDFEWKGPVWGLIDPEQPL